MSKICSICQRPFEEFGNNAQPVNGGRCCDDCDWTVVIPARMGMPSGSMGTLADYRASLKKAREISEAAAQKGKTDEQST